MAQMIIINFSYHIQYKYDKIYFTFFEILVS